VAPYIVKRKKQLFIFHRRHKNKGAKANHPPLLLLPLPTTPFYHRRTRRFHNLVESRSKDNQSINHQLSSSSQARKQSAQNPKACPGLAFGWQSRKLAQFVHFPSSIVCSIFLQSPPRSKTSSLNRKAKNQKQKQKKAKKEQFVHRKKKGNKKQRSLNKTLVCSVPFRRC
jgi:hypothetical protein